LELVLSTAPEGRVGEALTGRITFTSGDYYRSAEYEPGFAKEGAYSGTRLDTLRVSGTTLFTCLVRPDSP